MQQVYKGRKLWSAISKAFWMMKRHPVVIYDSFAWYGLQRLGLRPGYNTYREYFDSWFGFFERKDTQVALDDAVKRLAGLPFTQELIRKGLLTVTGIQSMWLRNRVTDMRLAFLGGWEL